MTGPYKTIIEGIQLDARGQAEIDNALTPHLIDLAIRIDDHSPYPIDVQHVVAAIILAVQQGSLSNSTSLQTSNPETLASTLLPFANDVYSRHNGQVGEDDVPS